MGEIASGSRQRAELRVLAGLLVSCRLMRFDDESSPIEYAELASESRVNAAHGSEERHWCCSLVLTSSAKLLTKHPR